MTSRTRQKDEITENSLEFLNQKLLKIKQRNSSNKNDRLSEYKAKKGKIDKIFNKMKVLDDIKEKEAQRKSRTPAAVDDEVLEIKPQPTDN